MLNIHKRDCLMAHINPREENHGDEELIAFDIKLTDIMLSAMEIGALMENPRQHELWFNTGVIPAVPITDKLEPYKHHAKVEGANVTLFIGLGDKQFKFADVKLKGITFEPMVGGLTAMSCKVQVLPTLNGDTGELMATMGKSLHVEISVDGYGDQAQLPLAA